MLLGQVPARKMTTPKSDILYLDVLPPTSFVVLKCYFKYPSATPHATLHVPDQPMSKPGRKKLVNDPTVSFLSLDDANSDCHGSATGFLTHPKLQVIFDTINPYVSPQNIIWLSPKQWKRETLLLQRQQKSARTVEHLNISESKVSFCPIVQCHKHP